jgi:hypothetical protein
MLAHWSTPTATSINVKTFHPLSLFCLPPIRTTAKATSVANSNTAAKLIMNPTLLHMEQKYRSSAWQSSYCGK